jgi:uncharacterized protein
MALDYFAPGVYVEEVDRGSRPIEGVNLSIAGFIGFTEDIRGGAEQFKPMLVTSWDQYLQYFGKPGSTGYAGFPSDPTKAEDPKAKKNFFFYLPFAVDGWFSNGGGRCWVVSIGRKPPIKGYSEPSPDGVKLLLNNSSKKPSLVFKFKPVEAAASNADSAPANSGEGASQPQLPPAPPLSPLQISIETDEPLDGFDTGEFFKIIIRDGEETLEEHGNLTMRQGIDPNMGAYVITQLADAEKGSKLITVALPDGVTALAAPANDDKNAMAKAIATALALRPTSRVYELVPPPESLDPDTWTQELQGVRKKKTGVQGIFEVDEVSMIACPDLMLSLQQGWLSWDQVKGFLELMVANCENAFPSPAFRMTVLDAPPIKSDGELVTPREHTPQIVSEWLSDALNRRSQFAAIYYPWIEVANPGDNGKPILVPPCGHMMGIWARVDQERGVFKAPANETPRGVLGLAYDVNLREQELLNPQGINCIRNFSNYTRGYKVWGARTLVEPDNIQWRYISVRRLMSYIAKSIEMGTQWVVFEPNDQDLWARVNRTVSNFLEGLWRQGALFGGSPAEAFYVKCDATINTPDTIMKGRLYIEIGVAPVRPAEFVIFQISQWSPNQ